MPLFGLYSQTGTSMKSPGHFPPAAMAKIDNTLQVFSSLQVRAPMLKAIAREANRRVKAIDARPVHGDGAEQAPVPIIGGSEAGAR
jgi:hypothetical protein